MSRKIDGKSCRYVTGSVFVIVRECRQLAVEALGHIRLRQIPPLVLRQCIRTRWCICLRDGRMVFYGGRNVAALAACGEGDALVRGGGGQPLGEGELARELAVSMALVGELFGECVQYRSLIPACNTVGVGEEGHDVRRTDRLVDDDVAALHRGRRRCIVVVDDGRMTAVAANGDRIGIPLIDDAVFSFAFTAKEFHELAFADVVPVLARADDFARADVLQILMIALVACLIEPYRAVSQVKLCITGIDESVQP